MKSSTTNVSIVALLLLLMLPERAGSCSCAKTTPCESFANSTAVFIGRMITGSEKVRTETNGDLNVSIEAGMVRFAVEETFKGDLGSEVGISVNSNKGTSCGPYGLIHGERYVVYAYGNAAGLSTGVCTRTSLVSKAGEDLGFLHNLPQTGSGGRLYGRVWADKNEGRATSLAGITLIVRTEGKQQVKLVTDEKGDFELTNLKPGDYQIEAVWPKLYESDRSTQEVTVSDRGCTGVYFEGKLNGYVSGRVFDSRRRPASVMLHLSPVGSSDGSQAILGYSHQDGNFDLPGIPPGRYLLYFELLSDGWKNRQQYFYPGVNGRAEATVINVGLGEQVSGYDFQLPFEFLVQTLEGWVVWPDGTPAADVEVMLLCPKSPLPQGFNLEFGPPQTKTDERGVFKLQGFKGNSYWIEARGNKTNRPGDKGVEAHSPARQLTLKADLGNLKLVLSASGFSGGCDARTTESK